jgi:two-component system, OmpR family, response regulator
VRVRRDQLWSVAFNAAASKTQELRKEWHHRSMESMGNGSGHDRRALVVEDDEDIRALIEFTLQTQGFQVTAVDSGLAGVEAVRELDPDLVTLDLGLPGIDGIEACRRIREISDAYVVMITARDDEIDKLLGLETGADDFISKPFSARELKARVNAMFRRPRTGNGAPTEGDRPGLTENHEILEHGVLRVDVDGRRAFREGTELELTRTEFDLLSELMRTPARVWSREALLRTVWGTEWASDTHLVEVHIGNLRRKLGERNNGARFIRTVRGVGYRMELAD